ncbi:GNAT family N-acetyltransferase [Streptomyces sp. NPDC101181]|uniref:GNAT family N-acetyltransferase n=1 Tax=Streptomyces sp. NPDC101181 TaxID=3366125 RepID=UPI00380A3B43
MTENTPAEDTPTGNTPPEIKDDREHGALTAYVAGEPAGSIAYFVMEPAPGALVAVHTVVRPEHEGKGVAGALVREFYALAARDGVPVVPLCPYAATWARRHPEAAPEAPEELVREAKRQLRKHPELF